MNPTHSAASSTQARSDRRTFIATTTRAAAVATVAATSFPKVFAERNYNGRDPVRYPDVDLIELDPRFSAYKIGNTDIRRIYHDPELFWAEGTAWNAVGRYLVWSDIPNDRQFRWIEDDGHVSTFRQPAGTSNVAAGTDSSTHLVTTLSIARSAPPGSKKRVRTG